jgi:hypothetical protein
MALITLASVALQACQPDAQRRFAAPQQAVEALLTAAQASDDTALLEILGPDATDLIHSGDPVADRNGRTRFARAYQRKHSLVERDADRVVLLVGSREYPFPIPVVREKDTWYFDTRAGMEEILNRRIGRNELHTLGVLQAYTLAQREYASRNPDGAFAQRFASSPGTHDGLYWETAQGEQESPLGPLIARATAEHYDGGLGKEPPQPFHGYYFRILKAQGPHASGGAFDYVTNGRMLLGFALVAYPARYGASGIMTFLVNQQGVIYQKNLGEDTAQIADAMTAFDPDDSWGVYREPAGE